MSNISFKLTNHSVIANRQTVEVLIDGVVCATITAGNPGQKAIRIMSAHIDGDQGDDKIPAGVSMIPTQGSPLPIPVVQIRFDPKPYRIEGGKIVRESRH